MLTQNYALDFLSKTASAAKDVKFPDKSAKNGFSGFQNYLNDTMSKNTMQLADSKLNQQAEKLKFDQNKSFEQGRQVKSYRDIVKSSKQEVYASKVDRPKKDNTTEGKKADKDTDSDKTKVKSEVALSSLAQLLGISTDELGKIMESANINIENLSDSTKLGEISAKLSACLGVGEKQEQALKAILAEINQQVELAFSQNGKASGGSDLNSRENWVKLDGVELDVIDNTNKVVTLSSIAARLKMQLENITEKLNSDPQSILGQISSDISELVANKLADLDQNMLENQSDGQTVSTNNTIGETGKNAADSKSDERSEEKEDLQKTAASENKTDKAGIEFAKQLNGQNLDNENSIDSEYSQFNTMNVNQQEKTGQVVSVIKAGKEISVPKSEIINQVVEKAKVILNGDKSEMVMKLNPESLGKIALKVVTERGMVVAKFIADNYQVKEVLEANMQLLKDSLEKQGLSIQGFSVSVGQENSRGFNSNRGFNPESKSPNGNSKAIDSTMIGVESIASDVEKANPYNLSSSNINLTA